MTTDLTKLKPRALEAYLREVIRKTHGDKVENGAYAYATSGGNYTVVFSVGEEEYSFTFKKKSAARIVKAIRALKPE